MGCLKHVEEGNESTDEVENFAEVLASEGTKPDSSRLNASFEHSKNSHEWLIAFVAILVAPAAAFLMIRSSKHQGEPAKTPVNVQPMPAPASNDTPSWKIERLSTFKKAP